MLGDLFFSHLRLGVHVIMLCCCYRIVSELVDQKAAFSNCAFTSTVFPKVFILLSCLCLCLKSPGCVSTYCLLAFSVY